MGEVAKATNCLECMLSIAASNEGASWSRISEKILETR